MDLVEISYHDYLSQCANGIYFDNWFTYDWCNYVLTYCMKGQYAEKVDNSIHINENFTFVVGDDLIELVDGIFEIEPHTQIIPPVEGRLTTLVMISNFKVKNGKIKGNICVRNPTQDPINAKYELVLKSVEVKGIVGLEICGDGFNFNHGIYKYSNPEISFFFIKDSEKESIFDKVIDISHQTIFKNYILDYFMKDVTRAIEEFQFCRLSIKQTVSELCGNDYSLRNVLRTHNKKLHIAFNNLAKEIMRLTNIGVRESLIELQLNKVYGLTIGENDEKKLEIYKGMLCNLDSMSLPDKTDVIISNDNENVIAYVPIVFDLSVKYTDYTEEESNEEETTYKHDEVYRTTRSYFTMSLKKLDDDTVEIDLLDLKIENFEKGHITLDFSITSVMEDVIKPYLEQAVKNDDLQKLAVNPEVEIDYDDDDYFATEDSDEEMFTLEASLELDEGL